MESTFLWQANLKSATMTVTNLRTIFESQLTSTFYLSCLCSTQGKFNLFSQQNPGFNISNAGDSDSVSTMLCSIADAFANKCQQRKEYQRYFFIPKRQCQYTGPRRVKTGVCFFTKVIRHRRSSGINHGTINKRQSLLLTIVTANLLITGNYVKHC